MNDLILELAQARRVHAEFKEALSTTEQEIQEVIDERYGSIIEHQRSLLSTAKSELEEADMRVRQAALDAYARDGAKKPHPAVQVKIYTVLEYDQEKAIKLALPGTVKLLKTKFEKVAKVTPLDFVTVRKEPRATVAKDLPSFCKEAA